MLSSGIIKRSQPGSLVIEKASRATNWDCGTFPGPKYFRNKNAVFPEELEKGEKKNSK